MLRETFNTFKNRLLRNISSQESMTIQLDITNSCNLACNHCYHSHHNNKGALKFDQWKEVLEQYYQFIEELNLDGSVILCGGEPLLFPQIVEFLLLIQKNKRIKNCTIMTNGTKITEQLLIHLKEIKTINFEISLDGPNRDTHDIIRGEGSFSDAKNGIILLKQYGFNVALQAVLSKQSFEWIEEFFLLAKELNVDGMNFARLILSGTAKKKSDLIGNIPLEPLELKRAYENILNSSIKYKVLTSPFKPLMVLINENLGSHHGFGIDGIIIDYKGNLKISSRTDFIVGNVLDKGLKNLYLKDPILKALRTGKINGCGSCQYLKKCGGDRNASYAHTGSFLEKDPACWL